MWDFFMTTKINPFLVCSLNSREKGNRHIGRSNSPMIELRQTRGRALLCPVSYFFKYNKILIQTRVPYKASGNLTRRSEQGSWSILGKPEIGIKTSDSRMVVGKSECMIPYLRMKNLIRWILLQIAPKESLYGTGLQRKTTNIYGIYPIITRSSSIWHSGNNT